MEADAYVEKTSTSQEMNELNHPTLSRQEWENTKKEAGSLEEDRPTQFMCTIGGGVQCTER
jgi:hypothetical protein